MILLSAFVLLNACTQEPQNKIGRAVQNWTGTNSVLEINAGNALIKRFLEIDKLLTRHPYMSYSGSQENLRSRRGLPLMVVPLTTAATRSGCFLETPKQSNLMQKASAWTHTRWLNAIFIGAGLITTASSTDQGEPQSRPYRFGYGVIDENLNDKKDANEKKVYFEFSDYSTSHVILRITQIVINIYKLHKLQNRLCKIDSNDWL